MYTINGRFLSERITGMQRYAYEVVAELDKICRKNEFEIVTSSKTEVKVHYKNIPIIKYGNLQGIPWEQLSLPRYLYKNKRTGIHMLSSVPILKSSDIVVAHGVNNKVNPQFYKTTRDKIARAWHNLDYYFYFKNSKCIFTVSEFSKSEIIKTYGVKPEYIHIAPNAWQHMERISEDENTFKKYNFIEPGNYYFSMSSVNENKNFKWIAEVAKRNKEQKFAIAGGRSLQQYFKVNSMGQPENLFFLGYVSDEEAKSLMKYCKAFLFPTFYEGFGIPPMEAMACGATAIVSDTPTMHEVYEDTVRYIDPYNYDVSLERVLERKTADSSKALSKYSWERTAKEIYDKLLR